MNIYPTKTSFMSAHAPSTIQVLLYVYTKDINLCPGFHLQCPDCKPFPVNAKSVQYLVSNGYIEMPEITADEIWDKSKADSFAKGAVLFQGAWLVTQSIAREAQGLPITPLELFTLAFVVSTAMSYFFWWRKPQNVSTNTTLVCDYSIARIRADAGQPPDGWEQTPLDWVESEGRRWTRRKSFSHFGMGTIKTAAPSTAPATAATAAAAADLEKSNSRAFTAVSRSTTLVASEPFPLEPEPKRPVQRIANDAIMPAVLSAKIYAGLIIPSMIHSCIHILGWNMDYPSNIEKQLWRASTVALAAMSCIAVGAVRTLNLLGYKGRYTLVFVWVNVESCRAQETEVHGQSGGNRTLTSFGRWCWARIMAVAKRVTVAEILLSLATFVLVLARLYIIVEVVISLRSQPEGVYVSIDWLSFLPHV